MARASKNPDNLPVQFDEELARQAQAYRDAEAAAATGNFITVRGGILQWRGSPLQDNKLDCIILASVFENNYYEQAFDPDNPRSPECYAFGRTQDELKPTDDCEKKQGDDNGLCAACWANGFNSAPDGGRGKACQNRRRLAVIPATNLNAASITAAEVAMIKLPVMSVSGYSNHVMQIADLLKLPPYGVVTELKVVPDKTSQFRVLFSSKSQIKDKAVLMALFQKSLLAGKGIVTPYPKNTDTEPPVRRRAPARSKAPVRTARAQRRTPAPAAAPPKPARQPRKPKVSPEAAGATAPRKF